MDIPVISRLYLTGAFLTTAACAVDIITPFSLYFSWDLIKAGQVWRLLTSYLFFGVFSIDFLFHMYFLVSEWTSMMTLNNDNEDAKALNVADAVEWLDSRLDCGQHPEELDGAIGMACTVFPSDIPSRYMKRLYILT